MKLIITDRDKKLLVFLGIFLIIFGSFYFIINPVINQILDLQTQISVAESEKNEKEQKVLNLTQVLARKSEMQKALDEAQSIFFESMKSSEIDRILTSLAVARELEVNEMDIQVPEKQEYTRILPYAGDQSDAKAAAPETYTGTYDAVVHMTMTGTRENLQKMVDACVEMLPQIQVTSQNWTAMKMKKEPQITETQIETADSIQKAAPEFVKGQETYRLVLSVDVFMYQDEEEYYRIAEEQTEAETSD